MHLALICFEEYFPKAVCYVDDVYTLRSSQLGDVTQTGGYSCQNMLGFSCQKACLCVNARLSTVDGQHCQVNIYRTWSVKESNIRDQAWRAKNHFPLKETKYHLLFFLLLLLWTSISRVYTVAVPRKKKFGRNSYIRHDCTMAADVYWKLTVEDFESNVSYSIN